MGFEVTVDDWFIRTVMTLYTEAYTVVRTDAVLSESFEVRVGLHQGSVLSPLMFAVVVRLRSWFVSVKVSLLEIAEFPDRFHWFAP